MKKERVRDALFFEPLGVGHSGSERLASARVDRVADDRSADANVIPVCRDDEALCL
jgi:hypothetical protein